MRGAVKDPIPEEISQSGQDSENVLNVQHKSPWEAFVKVYKCELAGRFNVAIPRVRPERIVAIREIQVQNIDQILRLFREIQHPNILSSRECFLHESSIFIVHDNIPISLDHIVACEAYPDEVELAAIMAQVCLLQQSRMYAKHSGKVLDGLLHLTDKRGEHPHLNSSNILVTEQGVVKIGMHYPAPSC